MLVVVVVIFGTGVDGDDSVIHTRGVSFSLSILTAIFQVNLG